MLGIHNDLVHHDFIDGFTGITDLPEGASAGYGLRKLSGSWADKCGIVRRDSDDEELAFGFLTSGTQAIDVNAIETFCAGTDGFIKSWYDQTGQGNHVTQTDHALQPQLVSNGSIIRNPDNNLPAIRFNGDGLGRSGADTNLLLDPGVEAKNTVFFLAKANTGNTSTQELFATDKVNSTIAQPGDSNDGFFFVPPGKGGPSLDQRYLSSNIYDTYIHTVYGIAAVMYGGVNGSYSLLLSAGGNSLNNQGIHIGRGEDDSAPRRFDGYVQEMIFYNLDLTATQTQEIADAINSFYSVY